MNRIRVTNLIDLLKYPEGTKIEIYNLYSTEFNGDRDRHLYHDGDLKHIVITDDSGGIFVEEDLLKRNLVFVCVPEDQIKIDSSLSQNTRTPISPKLRVEIFLRDGSRCAMCGTTAKRARLEIDHILPVSRGGTNDPSNLQVLCVTCNQGKSNRKI